jgi:SPP1 gp7 family putative phage head morphogenesis protein
VGLGGRLALQTLGGPDYFTLADAEILALVERHVQNLIAIDADVSLIQTTINGLSRAIWREAQAGLYDPAALASIIVAYVPGISASRAVLIAETEGNRALNAGLLWTYARNGVREVVFTTRGDDVVCTQCSPYSGNRYMLSDIPAAAMLPLHPRCRCIWLAVLEGWTPPLEWWTGGVS